MKRSSVTNRNLLTAVSVLITLSHNACYVTAFKDYGDYVDSLRDKEPGGEYDDGPGFRDPDDPDYPWTWIDWTDINSEFHTREIIPDVVKKAPEWPVKVFYATSLVDFGNKYFPIEFKRKPRRLKWNAEEGAYYTLIVTGPDCPSQPQPTKREWQHWLVVNIPGMDWEKGETLTEYAGLSRLYKPGEHRIVYLVYKQPGNKTIHFDEERLKAKSSCDLRRSKFKTKRFVRKYKLGDPAFGNFCWLHVGDKTPFFIFDDEDDYCKKTNASVSVDLPGWVDSVDENSASLTTLKMKAATTKKVVHSTVKPTKKT